MGHGLDFSKINLKGGLDKTFSVSSGCSIGNVSRIRKLGIEFFQHGKGGFHGLSFIVPVEGIQQVFLVVDEGSLRRSRTGIDPKIDLPLGLSDILSSDFVFIMTAAEFLKFGIVPEKRINMLGFRQHGRVCFFNSGKDIGQMMNRMLFR